MIERARPQVDRLLLSVESASTIWDGFGLQQVSDPCPGHCGPLGGLLAALRCLRPAERWLLLLPCDAPFIPMDLGERLLRCAIAAGRSGAVVRSGGRLQPTFSLWGVEQQPRLEQAISAQGMAGFHEFLDISPLATLRWPEGDEDGDDSGRGPWPFFNVNDPAGLERAQHWFDGDAVEERLCSA